MDHYVGDVVNGHVLGVDRAWHPMTYANVPSARSTTSYGARYHARWKWTAVACALLTVLTNMGQLATSSALGTVMNLVLYAIAGALGSGTILNFLVAAIPRRRSAA